MPRVEPQPLELIEHAFTHFDLVDHAAADALCRARRASWMSPASLWYNPRDPDRVGLPAPIKALLTGLTDRHVRRARSTDDSA